jgi:uncharacterized repeat protein (TIGR03803 family)
MRSKYAVLALTLALLLGFPMSALAAVKYKVLHSFGSGQDAAGPNGPLALDGNGKVYGVTAGGGDGCTGGCGTVFKLTPRTRGTWGEAILYNFPGGDYSYPGGVLTFHRTGDIYGTMAGYEGGVFELSPSSDGYSFSALYSDHAGPGLLMDELGNLYGEMGSGQYKGGAIAELSPGADGWTYSPLHSFDGTDGLAPEAPPIWDGKGDLFGTTMAGGVYKSPCQSIDGCGVIYEMTPNGDGTWTYDVLHRFASFKTDGQTPKGGLAMDAAGDFYGTTELGGAYDNGIVFKLSHATGAWKVTELYNFPDCNIGCVPNGTLAIDAGGSLYGAASGGLAACGGYDCGVVFKLSPQKGGKWSYSVLHKFTATDGGFLDYGVILDGKGNVFGVTSQFGKYGYGTAFEIIP